MNRTASLILAGLLAAAGASAGPLLTGELTVAAGETNAVGEITLNPSGALEAPAIDCVFVLNASGAGTGTVAFAALAAGVAVPDRRDQRRLARRGRRPLAAPRGRGRRGHERRGLHRA